MGRSAELERCGQPYTAHGRPKQLWVRELRPKARAVLNAGQLPADLQHVEDAVIPRCDATVSELR